MLFQVPAEITKVQSMSNRSIRLQVDTHENMTEEAMARLMTLHGKYLHACFLPDKEIQPEDVIDLPPLPKRGDKSKAERLRAVIWHLGRQRGEKDDDAFYDSYMEKIIDKVKELLD